VTANSSAQSRTAVPKGAASTDPATRRRWTLPVLCAAVFLNALDSSIVAVALPTIQREVDLPTTTLQWVVSGFALGYGGFLLLGGRIADAAGRRRMLLASVAAFALAASAAGLAGSGSALVAARIAAGTSLAFVVPAALAIIASAYPEGAARSHALGVYSAVGGGGWTAGLLLGGLATAASWRLVFLLQVPVAVAILVATPRAVPPDGRCAGRSGRPDVAGAALGTAALLTLVYVLTTVAARSLSSVGTLVWGASAALLAAAFVVVERRAAEPLLPFELFRSRNLSCANLVAFAYFGSYSGYLFIGTLYLQQVLGWSPLRTALAFLPAAVLAAAVSGFAGTLIQRRGLPTILLAGMLTMLTAYALLLRIGASSSYLAVVLPTVVLVGLGAAITFPSITDAGLAGVASDRQGLVGGLVNTSMQAGAGIVLAVISAAIAIRTGATPANQSEAGALLAGYRLGLGVTTAVAALGVLAVLLGLYRTPARTTPRPAGQPAPITPEPGPDPARRGRRRLRAARTTRRRSPASGR
jgi:MFS family permease